MRKHTLNQKVIVITGASSGIGRALAVNMSSHDAKIMLAARREKELQEAVDEIRSKGGVAEYCITDVSKEADCKHLIEKTVDLWKTVDILICDAGISMRANFSDVDFSVIHKLMDVNFFGTVYCTKYALPYIQNSKGSIVGISSTAGIHGLPWRTGYSASKFAITGFLETVRIENLKKDVHVMIAYPGFTKSNIRYHALTANGLPQGNTPRNEEKMTSSEETAKKIIRGIQMRKQYQMNFTDFVVYFAKIFCKHTLNRVLYNIMAREPDAPTDENKKA